MRHRIFGRVSSGLLTAALAGFSGMASAAPPLLVTFKNETGVASSRLYVGFIGRDFVATDAATGKPMALTQYKDEHWYRLGELGAGIKLTNVIAGRIYVGYDAPWTFRNAGYEPSSAVPSDPNYFKRYDKLELTYKGSKYDVADTTSFDYFAIPMALNSYSGGKLVSSVTGPVTDQVIAALRGLTTPAGAAVVRDPKTHAFARVIGPGVYPPPPGLPASPYDNFARYLTYLQKEYAPAHHGVAARIKGHFNGVEEGGAPPIDRQDYDFTATINANLDITLTGAGTEIGKHAIFLPRGSLLAATGIYGANPNFSIDGGKPISPPNDVYGWIVGDLLSGLNVGTVGSTVTPSGMTRPVGEMNSQDWFKLKAFFGALQPAHTNNYNGWAATLSPLSQAYNFAYTDRFAHVAATLNPVEPSYVDRLEIVLLPDKAPAGRKTK